jgi:hypothetical protein
MTYNMVVLLCRAEGARYMSHVHITYRKRMVVFEFDLPLKSGLSPLCTHVYEQRVEPLQGIARMHP